MSHYDYYNPLESWGHGLRTGHPNISENKGSTGRMSTLKFLSTKKCPGRPKATNKSNSFWNDDGGSDRCRHLVCLAFSGTKERKHFNMHGLSTNIYNLFWFNCSSRKSSLLEMLMRESQTANGMPITLNWVRRKSWWPWGHAMDLFREVSFTTHKNPEICPSHKLHCVMDFEFRAYIWVYGFCVLGLWCWWCSWFGVSGWPWSTSLSPSATSKRSLRVRANLRAPQYCH